MAGLLGGVVAVGPVGGASAVSPTTIVVKPSATNGWTYFDESGATPTGSFVAGGSIGTGSARFQLPTASNGLFLGVGGGFAGTLLSDIGALRYDGLRSSADPGNNLAVALQFNVDYDATDASNDWQGRLVFEPYHRGGGGTIIEDSWQTFDTVNGTTGGWFGTRAPIVGGVSLAQACTMASPCSWAELAAAYPDARVRPGTPFTQSLFGFKAGSNWAGFDGNVDNLVVTVAGSTTVFDFEAETPCTTVCYVDATTGNDLFGGDTAATAKKTIQAAIDQVSPAGEVRIAAGTYAESVSLGKAGVQLLGAGAASTIISGPKTAPHTLEISGGAVGAVVDGVTVTRDGNNPTDWAGNSNSYGVKLYADDVTIRNAAVVGNRNGIYVESTDGVSLLANTVERNRTGVHLVNSNTDLQIRNNFVRDNTTMGILLREETGPVSVAGLVIRDNDISGNWYSQIEARASITDPTLDATRNWWGTVAITATNAPNSGEPGYAAQVPSFFGGTAVPPATAPTIVWNGAVNAANPVASSPFLCAGVDTSPATGFQPSSALCPYTFTGFFAPVDNLPTVNSANAGRTIPLKWRIVDIDGAPIGSASSIVSVTSAQVSCATNAPVDAIETTTASSSGLQYQGNGYWQYQWVTLKAWKGQCRDITVRLADGSSQSARFLFR